MSRAVAIGFDRTYQFGSRFWMRDSSSCGCPGTGNTGDPAEA